jgi:hypothetical protein
VEGILGLATVRGRIRQRTDRVEQLHDRAGPSVGHDQRQCIRVRRPHVDEVDVDAVDLRGELRMRVQPPLEATEVVPGRPVASEFLHRGQLDTLRSIGDQLLGGPARRRDAPAQVVDLVLADLELEGPNHDGRVGAGAHGSS